MTADQARECARRAQLRKRTSRNAEKDPTWSVDRTSVQEWEQEYGGVVGEVAAGLYYAGFGAGSVNSGQKQGDLIINGVRVQVRHAATHGRRLLLREDARERVDPDGLYVFVTGLPLTPYVRGWVTGRDGLAAAVEENPGGKRPCLFVPTAALQPPDTLPALRRLRAGVAP